MIFDVAIVGGGAAGSLLAWRLSRALPEASIVLVEAGRSSVGVVNRVPLLAGFASLAGKNTWQHEAEGPSGPQVLLQGRLLGGSSFVNGMVVSLGAALDYDAWAESAGPLWNWQECRKAFDALLGQTIPTRKTEPYGPLAGEFLQGAEALGFPLVDDVNGVDGERFSLTRLNSRDGKRFVSADLLRPAPANLTILCGEEVRKVDCQAGRAKRLLLKSGRILNVTSEIVLASGAVKTALLLMHSGIGPAQMLRDADQDVVLDVPELGTNLQNHPSFSLRFPTSGESLAQLMLPLPGAKALCQYLGSGRGPLAQGIFQAAGYFAVEPGEAAEAQCIFAPVLLPTVRNSLIDCLPRQHGATIAVQQGRPFSRGNVQLTPHGARIRTGAFSDPRDLPFLEKAVRRVQEIVRASPLERRLTDRSMLAPISGEEIRKSCGTAYHMAGTARMGMDDRAVTTPDLRLRGIDGIRIADASVMPLIPNAALHFPSMMIASRAADFMLAQFGAAAPGATA